MKRMIQKQNKQLAEMLGYGKKKKKMTEAVHMTSWAPAGQMAVVKDPQIFTDPAQTHGIEIGDDVALASSPEECIGELVGITGFRAAIVRNADSHAIQEYAPGTFVKCEVQRG